MFIEILEPISDQCSPSYTIFPVIFPEAGRLICNTSELTGFYMMVGINRWWVDFLRDPKSYDFQQLQQEFAHSLSGDNNVVLFHLWWRDNMLKHKKIFKYFVKNCSFMYTNLRSKWDGRHVFWNTRTGKLETGASRAYLAQIVFRWS